MLKRNCLFGMILLLSACASRPVANESPPLQSVVVDTLQGGVNVSLLSLNGKMSGNGVLFYKRPDSFRLTILAPFGQTLLDIIVNDGMVICLSGNGKRAWQGLMADLPDWLGVRVWPLLQWVMEPPRPAGASLERSFIRSDGEVEKLFYDRFGLLQRKLNSAGDQAAYSDYKVVDGVAVAMMTEISTVDGNRLKLVLDDPEVNRPIEKEILSPDLKGYEILPLADFKGF